MLLTEYNAKHQRKLDRRDARAEGRLEGREEVIERMLQKGRTPEEIADFCGYDIEMVRDIEKRKETLSGVK